MSLKPKQKKRLRIILSATAAAMIISAVLGWQLNWFRPPQSSVSMDMPGSASGQTGNFRQDEVTISNLWSQMVKLLGTDGKKSLASWYRLAGRIGKPAAEKSNEYLAEDQLRFGQFLLEQGNKKAFQAWWTQFQHDYLSYSPLVPEQPSGVGAATGNQAGDWRRSSMLLRLLAQSCANWPDRQRINDLQQLSDAMLQSVNGKIPADFSAAVPTPDPVPDPAATPTPKPAVSPQATPEAFPTLTVLRLASIDLYAMQQMASLDGRWETLRDRCLPLVENGYISDSLPLYALAYDASQDGYLPFSGKVPAVDTAEALLTILHLAEVGRDNPRSLSWIKDQIFNHKAVYDSYHITQGQPASNGESLASYAIIARIARIKNDQELYTAAIKLLLWHQATSQRSEALHAIYRQDESGVIFVFAADNTWTLLAIG
jgi:hypothetical protein